MKCAVPCPHDATGTPCQLEMFHAGNHSWPLVIDMEGWLPICRQCGGKAARCGCPAVGADGLCNAMPPPEPTLSDGLRAAETINATMHWPVPVPVTKKRQADPNAPDLSHRERPWCHTHGWDSGCECDDKPKGMG